MNKRPEIDRSAQSRSIRAQLMLKVMGGLILLGGFSGCQKSEVEKVQAVRQKAIAESGQERYQQVFEQWKLKQDQVVLTQYQSYFSSYVKQPPSLFELTFNAHPLKPECAQYRFNLPPKKYWKNLIEPLKLLEKLQATGYFSHYKIVSIYRSHESNDCARGVKGSRHLQNFAIDFQTLNEKKQHYPDHAMMEKKLCQFWLKEGKRFRLDLGVYGKQRFHIDTRGYRTWGKDYTSKTSPCLNVQL